MFRKILKAVLLFLYNLLYHQLAPFYDLIAWLVSGGAWFQWVKCTTKYIQGNRILEIGCGTGHLLEHLPCFSYQVIGIDKSREMIMVSSRRIKKLDLFSRVVLVRSESQSLPFRESFFDTVIATFPAPFIFEKVTIEEIHRSLNLGGSLIILLTAIPNGRYFKNLFSEIESNLISENRYKKEASEFFREFSEGGFHVTKIIEPFNGVDLLFLRCTKYL